MLPNDTLPAGAVRIPLYRRDGSIRAYAIVDEADATIVTHRRWYLSHGYVVRGVRLSRTRGTTVTLHRELLGLSADDQRQVDHINRDRLDCRRSNLRIVTVAENQQNVSSYTGSTSKHRGVSWNTAMRKWKAKVHIRGKDVYLGCFDSEEEAGHIAHETRLRLMSHAID